MQSLSDIRALLDAYGLRPNQRLGQNFLHDKNQITKLVTAASIQPGDLVLEVGPGTGTLTEALLERGATVVASEIDAGLADVVADRLGTQVTLVRGDCLGSGRAIAPAVLDALAGRPFKLVANLPYQVASPLMATLLIHALPCLGQFVTIQQEVAARLLAPPGGKTFGPLGIIVQALATVERIGVIGRSCFWPVPKVTSAMVAIRPRDAVDIDDRRAFARFVTELFGRRRKQLGTVFGRGRAWPEGVTADQRAETLSVAQIVELWRMEREAG